MTALDFMSNSIRKVIRPRKQVRYEIIDKKGPDYATILVDTRCKNSCVYCVNHCQDAHDCAATRGIYIKKHLILSLESLKRQVDILVKNDLKKIHLCGAGEPFHNVHMMDFIDYVIEKTGSVSFQTNFGEQFVKFIPEIVNKPVEFIGTDMVGGTRESFEKIKKGSCWDEVWKNIGIFEEECSKNGTEIPLHLYCVVNKQRLSYEHLDELVENIQAHRSIRQFVFHNIHAFGFNEFVDSKNIIRNTDEEVIRELDKVTTDLGRIGVEVIGPCYFTEDDRYNCRNFWSRIMLNFPNDKITPEKWEGNVMPGGCLIATMGHLHSIGNIYKEDFWDIWNSEMMTKARKKALLGQFPDRMCRLCPAHYIQRR